MIKVKKVIPAAPAPVITITLDLEFAKKLNQQLSDLVDRNTQPTRDFWLALNPVVLGEYAEMER